MIHQVFIRRWVILFVAFIAYFSYSFALAAQDPPIPTLEGQAPTSITQTDSAVRLTFGPVDISPAVEGHSASMMPRLTFQLDRDVAITGFHAAISTSSGTLLARRYLHHISLLNLDKPSSFCKGARSLLAGAGMEMNHVQFPPGYAVQLKKGTHLMGIASFYHDVPPVKDVMATFTLELAAPDDPMIPLDTYHVSVNVDCFTEEPIPGRLETEEGIILAPGLQTYTKPVRFAKEGCVKMVYPHGHDHLVLMVLENTTQKQTVLRTVPMVHRDGSLIGFARDQVYADSTGFYVTPDDDYEMMMIYYRPLQDHYPHHGMADYLLFMTPGDCPYMTAEPRR